MLFKDNNHITRNYYLNLFSANADIIKNGNNNFMYEWNIRDLRLGKYAEIALVQLASINTYLSAERQYPPGIITSVSTSLIGFLYGNGTYNINSSFDNSEGESKIYAFDNNNTTWWTPSLSYSGDNNTYNGGIKTTINSISYAGHWIQINLPIKIILTKYNLFTRNGFLSRGPHTFWIAGSNNGSDWVLIDTRTNITNYTTDGKTFTLSNQKFPYSFYRLIINRTNGDVWTSISEFQLFGREEIKKLTEERQYPPKLYNTSTTETTTTGELTGINPSTFYKQIITLNTDNIIYGFGDYTIYSSSIYTIVDQSLYRKRDLFNFNTNEVGAVWNTLYASGTGIYNGNNYIKSDYIGEWIVVKLPYAIVLQRFIFYGRPNTIVQAPSLWKCYGSNDGVNFTEITDASNDITPLTLESYDINRMYEKKVDNKLSYLYIGFTFNKTVGNHNLCFSELQLFGKEELNIKTPAAWYRFDGSSTEMLLDKSGNKKNLTNFNTVSLNTSDFKRGYGSAQFNGSNYFQINEPSYFSPNNSFSISLWMKLTNVNNNYKTIFSCRSETAGYNIYIVPTSYNMEIWTPNGIASWNQATLLSNYFGSFTNIWKHLTLTFNKRTSNNEIKLYLDGVLINTIINTTYVPNTNFSLRIGAGANELTAQFFLDNGSLLDDFRFYNSVLTANEVKALYYGSELTQNFDEKFVIRSLNCYDDGYDNVNTTSAILYTGNELTSPPNPTYHKLNTYNLNRISLQVSNDIDENKPYNGWDSLIQFGAVFHIKDYKQD